MRLKGARSESLLDFFIRKGVVGNSYNGLSSKGTPLSTSKSCRAENCSCQHNGVWHVAGMIRKSKM